MRKKIRQAMALDRLIKAFNGELELTTVQANIGLKLIGKILPDLKAVEQSGSVEWKQSVINAQPDETADEWVNNHASSGVRSQDRKPH